MWFFIYQNINNFFKSLIKNNFQFDIFSILEQKNIEEEITLSSEQKNIEEEITLSSEQKNIEEEITLSSEQKNIEEEITLSSEQLINFFLIITVIGSGFFIYNYYPDIINFLSSIDDNDLKKVTKAVIKRNPMLVAPRVFLLCKSYNEYLENPFESKFLNLPPKENLYKLWFDKTTILNPNPDTFIFFKKK